MIQQPTSPVVEADLPPVVAVERRKGPEERRTVWRGGRRDSDWINRPPGALRELEESRQRLAGIWRRLASFSF